MSGTDQGKEKEGIQRASVMLLSGWKMLAICCPLCHMALFSKDGEIRCAKCELPVKMETGSCGSHAVPDFDEHSESAVVESATLSTYDEMKKEYAEKRKRSDMASAKLGQKLLEGWTMIAEYCPGEKCAYSPLVSRDGGSLVICPVCEVVFVQSDGGHVPKSKGGEEKEDFVIEKRKPTLFKLIFCLRAIQLMVFHRCCRTAGSQRESCEIFAKGVEDACTNLFLR